MPTLVTLAVVLISGVLLLVSLVGCSKSTGADAPESLPAVEQSVTAEGVSRMSEDSLRQMLADLKRAPPPEPKMGAMCYSPRALPSQADYVCPECGEKTVYGQPDEDLQKRMQVILEVRSITSCLRELASFPETPGVTFTLDQAEFCSHCQPEIESPSLVLTVKYKDGRSHQTRSVNEYDLRILRDFLKGDKAYETFNDGTHPLKDCMPRLRDLLGLEEEDASTEDR